MTPAEGHWFPGQAACTTHRELTLVEGPLSSGSQRTLPNKRTSISQQTACTTHNTEAHNKEQLSPARTTASHMLVVSTQGGLIPSRTNCVTPTSFTPLGVREGKISQFHYKCAQKPPHPCYWLIIIHMITTSQHKRPEMDTMPDMLSFMHYTRTKHCQLTVCRFVFNFAWIACNIEKNLEFSKNHPTVLVK